MLGVIQKSYVGALLWDTLYDSQELCSRTGEDWFHKTLSPKTDQNVEQADRHHAGVPPPVV